MSPYTNAQLAKEIRETLSLVTKALRDGETVDPEWFVVLNGNVAELQDRAEGASVPEFTYEKAAPEVVERNLQMPYGANGRCVRCCAPIRSAKSAWWVHPKESDYNVLWPNDCDPSAYDTDSMGGQPIGPECAKYIPARFKVKASA